MSNYTLAFLALLLFATGLRAQEYGEASYYSDKFQGSLTYSGEPYDRDALTAAHKSLAIGTQVSVTNIDNGRSVRVRINDRLPDVKGRVIDLSYAAAREIGMLDEATAQVKLGAFEDAVQSILCRDAEVLYRTVHILWTQRLVISVAFGCVTAARWHVLIQVGIP